MNTYEKIFNEAKHRDPKVREISYDQFMKIKKSGESFKLLDVLPKDNFEKGHIENAISMPLGEINRERTSKMLSKTDNIITYCGGFKCPMSTEAAKKLMELGYTKVLDYKGGIEEWEKRGNKLAVFHR